MTGKQDPMAGVAVWADTARDATMRRDEAIRQAVAEGNTLRAVAEAAGLSHEAIRLIAQREG